MESPLHFYPDYGALCRQVALQIAQLVRDKPDAVLGLATGSTPIGVYDELIRLHREENLDFSRVTTFNLDEYFPMEPSAPQSYRRFMQERLFHGINCRAWHVPSGQLRSSEQVEADCAAYEAAIRAAGGLDFQLLGIGRTGHIGFNEPSSAKDSRTRLVTLDYLTRADAADDFFGLENVPVRAITMGIGTVLDAREIVLMAAGAKKAAIIAQAVEGKITSKVPASFLREHPNASFHLDEAAAADLTHFAQPWRASSADFANFALRRRALISVSQELDKPLSKLVAPDLHEAGIGRLAHEVPSLEAAAQEVERDLGGKLDDEAHLPRGQTVLCLSPHPDDDVICCGATLLKLAARDNRIFVAYGVSGANAVRDKDVLALLRARHPRLISFLEAELDPGKSLEDAVNEVRSSIFEREPGAPDAPLLRELKRLVREGEAADACRKIGAKPIFLNLPFYGDGVQRKPIGEADVSAMQAMLNTVKPDVVLLTGEKNDPHGTHALCEAAFERAAANCLSNDVGPFQRWLYRGAWDDYEVWEGDYFSVFGRELMDKKIGLILDHISQLDPLFPGAQPGEFWERARARNRENARQLQRLGVLPPSRSFDPIYVEVFQIISKP